MTPVRRALEMPPFMLVAPTGHIDVSSSRTVTQATIIRVMAQFFQKPLNRSGAFGISATRLLAEEND
jgi:hypothetical protein